MLRSIVVCSGVLGIVSGFTDMGPASECIVNQGAFPLAARVLGCERAPCALAQKKEAVIDIAFRAPRDISTMTTTVEAYLTMMGIDIPIPYDLAEKSATCKYLLNSTCPVRESEILLYTLKLFIAPTLPLDVKTAVEVSIVDDAGPVVCLRVPLIVKASRTPQPTVPSWSPNWRR